ncbi:MAG: hypothetical protein AAGB11_15760 [Pseudomonadota bacterium]
MSMLGRTTLGALVFAGSVAAAAYAANNAEFYASVKNSVADVSGHFVTAGRMVSGDAHLADPAVMEAGDKLYDDRIASSSVVTHVEVIGGGPKQRIVLLNPQGQEVFSHDPEANTTIVAKDTIIPSITVRDSASDTAELRVVTAAPKIEAPEALREALVAGVSDQPELFYREDL